MNKRISLKRLKKKMHRKIDKALHFKYRYQAAMKSLEKPNSQFTNCNYSDIELRCIAHSLKDVA